MNSAAIILSLLLPIVNGYMMYDSNKDIINKDIIKISNFKGENIYLIPFGIITIIHIGILLGIGSNPITFGVVIVLWISFLIVYQIMLKKQELHWNYLTPFSKFQNNIKIKGIDAPFDSMEIFKVIYALLAFIILFLIKENKVVNIVVLISFGFLFQLINSTILYALSNNVNIIPSVFVYLDEYIKNSNKLIIKNKDLTREILGLVRIILVILLSIFLGHSITKNKSSTTKILSMFITFTSLIALWIVIIGDECINERTFYHYKGKGYEHRRELWKPLLPEVLQSQGGATFNISLLIIANML